MVDQAQSASHTLQVVLHYEDPYGRAARAQFRIEESKPYESQVPESRRGGEPLAPVCVVALRAPSRLAVLRPVHLVDATRAPRERTDCFAGLRLLGVIIIARSPFLRGGAELSHV